MVYLVCFVYLVISFNQINQTNQINRIDQTDQARRDLMFVFLSSDI